MMGGRGDKRSKAVRERSRSSAAFASSFKGSVDGHGKRGGITPSSPKASQAFSSFLPKSGHGDPLWQASEAYRSPKDSIHEHEEEQGDAAADPEEVPALFTSLCYKGMEVIFTVADTTSNHDICGQCCLLGIAARTRSPFQTCPIYVTHSDIDVPLEIVHLTSHPTSGWVFAADSFGYVHSFYPVLSDTKFEPFGKFRWIKGAIANCRDAFGYSQLTSLTKRDAVVFHRRPKKSGQDKGPKSYVPHAPQIQTQTLSLMGNQPPLPAIQPSEENYFGVLLSASMTEKRVLIAHKDQLAIFDFSPSKSKRSSINSFGPTHSPTEGSKDKQSESAPHALLVWINNMRAIINHISLSGDGSAIALVLQGEGVGVPYPFGVRTFVRDQCVKHSPGAANVNRNNKNSSNGANLNDAASSAGCNINGTGKSNPSSTKAKHSAHRRTGSALKALPVDPPPLPKTNNFDGLLDNVFGNEKSPDPLESVPPDPPPLFKTGGIIYKPGQFLVHSAPVTRLSFRGSGTLTSSCSHNSGWNEEEEGNDLLLTTCSSDSSVRIFSQNSWRQLMHWASPPKSRADWVRGITAANLGDLDSAPSGSSTPKKKKATQRDSVMTPIPKTSDEPNLASIYSNSSPQHTSPVRPNLPRQMSDISAASDTSGGINRALLSSYNSSTTSSFPSHSVPGTHAGAWIAELTFRNAFPALRLSRLSYIKTGGDDALPAHFESVAAILPPGSLTEEVVLDDGQEGERRMEVEGIWPAWDAWESDWRGNSPGGGITGGGRKHDGSGIFGKGTLTSKAEALALNPNSGGGANIPTSSAGAPRWLADSAGLGGSHIPPSELRITSSHLRGDCLVQIEMPLWGDKDFGAMEFGAPLRYVMSVPEEMNPRIRRNRALLQQLAELPSACLEYESGSRLCARASLDRRSIDLSWKKHGAVAVEEVLEASKLNTFLAQCSPFSGAGVENDEIPKFYQDLSLNPLALCLPSLHLPGHRRKGSEQLHFTTQVDKHAVSSLHWWPDENFGGPPRLAALTAGGTIIVYEMPPPWSALEPPMPSYDPFDASESRGSSVASDFGTEELEGASIVECSDDDSVSGRYEYEVSITPHPDFGLGLRLEAQAQGMPTVAGSFKKHPLSGGRLPAERCGAIMLGDELLAVNNVNLEGYRFEDAIAAIRQIGFDSYGAPLRMHFRRCGRVRKRDLTIPSICSKGSKLKGSNDKGTPDSSSPTVGPVRLDESSHATVEVGADAEIQQEYGRIIAVVRDVICGSSDQASLVTPSALLLLPWNFGKGATVSHKMYGGALIVWASSCERVIKAARLEVVLDVDPENARFEVLGSFCLSDKSGNDSPIKRLSFISSTEKGWSLAVHDCVGNISLLFIETVKNPAKETHSGAKLSALFRYLPCIFNCHGENFAHNKHDPRDTFVFRSFSLEHFGCIKKNDPGCKELTIWSALPQSLCGRNNAAYPVEYNKTSIAVSDIQGQSDAVLDFKWLTSGFVDAFPWLVLFTQNAVVAYRRSCTQLHWHPITVISYPSIEARSIDKRRYGGLLSPHDAFPHLVTALHHVIISNDEQCYMRSDWHPESIIASLCAEEGGVKLALNNHVRRLYCWLSQFMNADESILSSWDSYGSLPNAPFRIVSNDSLSDDADSDDDGDAIETSISMMTALNRSNAKQRTETELLLCELQDALCPDGIEKSPDKTESSNISHSKEFTLLMSQGRKDVKSKKSLPILLQKLNEDELLCIWAIGEILKKPPSFKKLDTPGQFFIFSVSLMTILLDAKIAPREADKSKQPLTSMSTLGGGRAMLYTQSSSKNLQRDNIQHNRVASAALLSALMSDTQAKLLSVCRPKGERMTWELARSLGISFWVRSEKTLVSIAEEIGQTTYKATKDVMECALYFVASRKMKTLRAIASTDRSDSGVKFLKFITAHDFSSDRGRKAAEKNAYSLLRKRKYVSAAAFFLMAEPPMIKTSLEVITTQMQDPSLAFFVARLTENAPKPNAVLNDNLTIGGGLSLSSMGGGGGFASSFSTGESPVHAAEDGVRFDCWKPSLGKSSRSVLLSQGAASSDDDICYNALRLIWLGRPNMAKLCLSFMPIDCNSNKNEAKDIVAPCLSEKTGVTPTTGNGKILLKVNDIINFCSSPILLKKMKPKKRVLWSSALLVSRALSRRGIELPAIRILTQVADLTKDNEQRNTSVEGNNLSMFKSIDKYNNSVNTPPTKESPLMSDSIDVAHNSMISKTGEMSSSIFDSFDTGPPKPKAAVSTQSQTGEMSSSIFDSFDTGPPKPKAAVSTQSQTGEMSSSIFDSFDTGPPKPNSKSFHQHPKYVSLNEKPVQNEDFEEGETIEVMSFPELWVEWRERLIQVVAARRLLREMARIVSSFNGDLYYPPMKSFAMRNYPLVSMGAAEVLHKPCDGDELLNSVHKSILELSASLKIDETVIIERALEILSLTGQPRRIIFSVLLQCLIGRRDFAEDLIRDAAMLQMSNSEFMGLSNDLIVDNGNTKYYKARQWALRDSVNTIWQLELCLWLHRGGAFVMSEVAIKEVIIAVRVSVATSAWGRCHQSLETLIKAEPDCLMDFDAGRNLWRSMKIIVVNENDVDGVDGVSSGGWEFLVDCRREEATEMLRDGKTGQFLIRPHVQDPGVFTLSFKTNLVPTEPSSTTNYDEACSMEKLGGKVPKPSESKKVIKRDDVVQHAIIRLSDSGFRCGSFGPFTTLVKLLHSVSDSLPFDLRFNDPPIKGIINERGTQTSPNSFLFRKLALHSKSEFFRFQGSDKVKITEIDDCLTPGGSAEFPACGNPKENTEEKSTDELADLHRRFGLFSQLLFLSELRKQLCAVAAALEDDVDVGRMPRCEDIKSGFVEDTIDEYDGSLSEGSLDVDEEEVLGFAARMVRPLLNWCRSREIDIVDEIAPLLSDAEQRPLSAPLLVAVNALGTEFEVPSSGAGGCVTGGDSIIRSMIQTGSGVDFRTLRVGEAGNSVIVVLFSKEDALQWLISSQIEKTETEAIERLKLMEAMRIIEPITSSDLSIPKSYAASHPTTESRYRFVDPWEVEALESKAGETAGAAIGRGRYQAVSVGLIANSCEKIIRASGGLHLLGLWSTLKGGICLTKALASIHPSWERGPGGDLQMKGGFLMEPSPYENSIRQHLHGNSLFRRLELPQRFIALVQVELLDLKNVTSPSGASTLTAYALLRLKRQGSSAPLNHKARSLDSACTQARKISKSSGPNPPASWGGIVRFRFPLPEGVNCEGKSVDKDRESLFKGPPTCLQITVYEKKFMSDVELGGADVKLDALGKGGQIEEWVPLRAGKDGITWFARIRLSLRYELMCIESPDNTEINYERCPSVGLKKIRALSRLGAHEDSKVVKNSISTPDLMGYFGHMLY